MSKGTARRATLLLAAAAALALTGCLERPTLIPHPDPTLRKTSAQFSADAVKRHPFKAEAPKGEPNYARAEVGYMVNALDIANLSDHDWAKAEVWVNQQYVCMVPMMKSKELTRLNFEMLFDDNGNYFPRDNSKTLIKTVNVLLDGKMYDCKVTLAD
jgi:hypothetical protein